MMPVQKFKRIEDMPELWYETGDASLASRIQTVCQRAMALAGPLGLPRGVRKFRSFEEMAAEREHYEQLRIARLRAARNTK